MSYHDKAITGGHKYNDLFSDYLQQVSTRQVINTPSCTRLYPSWRKIYAPFAELKWLKVFHAGDLLFYNDNSIPVSSEEELVQILDSAGYPHPETLVLDGWEFSAAYISKALTPEGKNELIDESETADGKYVIQRYRIDKQHQIVTGYTVILKKGEKEGRYGSSATTKEELSLLSVAYPADGEVHAEKPSIPGMEDTLLTDYKDFSDLIMYRPLEKTLQVNGDIYGFATEVETRDYEMIMCKNLNPEEAASLFAESK